MFASPVETDIAPSGTLLGLLQRGRGDGWLHALAAPRPEAIAALEHCVLRDPRRDWQLEDRSRYYAQLYVELDAGLGALAGHLFPPGETCGGVEAPGVDAAEEERTGLCLSVLGHLTSYGDEEALSLLRRYAVSGANWRWALDELAVRDSDAGLRRLGPEIMARFPLSSGGDNALREAVRDSFEPRPWRVWAEDLSRPQQSARLRRATDQGAFDRWQRQLQPPRRQPGWSVASVLEWAQEGYEQFPPQWREAPAARCLAAVAGPADRPRLLDAARHGPPAVRAAALRHLAEREDSQALDLLQAAVVAGDDDLARAAVTAFSRMRGEDALDRARDWAGRSDRLGAASTALLACWGTARDAPRVLAALRRTVRELGTDTEELWPLVEGAGRLAITAAAPVLRHIYRETTSSRLRGHTAPALASTDPSFGAGFAIECLWDCEQDTREVAARFATTGDTRVLERLRLLAADPAEQDAVQSAVRGRLADGAAG